MELVGEVEPELPEDYIFGIVGNVYVVDGDTADWGNNDVDDAIFTYASNDGDVYTYSLDKLTLLADGVFKVRKDREWTINYGYSDITIEGDPTNFVDDGGNIKVVATKKYSIDFILDVANDTKKLVFTELPEYPATMFMIGNALNLDDSDSNGTPDGWQWELTDAPMIPVHSKPHLFWKIVWLNATGEFKFAPEKAWGNDFGYDSDLGSGEYSIGGTNLSVTGTSGYYMVVVDLEANKISIADPDVYLMGNTVGSWDTANPDAKFTVDNEVITITKDLAADEIRMYAWHPYFTDWWQSEFIVLSNVIEFRGNGDDQTRVNVTAGSNTVELNFKTGAGSITHN